MRARPAKATTSASSRKASATTPAAPAPPGSPGPADLFHVETVGDRIEQARRKLGLSSRALAKRAGLSPTQLSTIVRRYRANADAETALPTLQAIAKAADVSLAWLVGDPAPSMPKALAVRPPPPKGPTFHAAIEARLKFLADQPVTPRILTELGRLSSLGVELLALTADPTAVNTRRRGGGLSNVMSNYVAVGSPYSVPSVSFTGGDGEDDVMAPAPPAETFGSTMMREAISGLTALTSAAAAKNAPSVLSLVDGIAAAKRAGLRDVEADLRAQLKALTPAASSPAAPPTKPGKPAKRTAPRPPTL